MVFDGGCSSPVASSSAENVPEKLLQVDIYLFNVPQRHHAVTDNHITAVAPAWDANNNNSGGETAVDAADLLAQQFGTATTLFDVHVMPPTHNGADDHAAPPSAAAVVAEQCHSRLHRSRVRIDRYRDGAQLADIIRLIDGELSEPYSFYTYLYFTYQWPELCVLAIDCDSEAIVGAILCKLDSAAMEERHHYSVNVVSRGYIGMLAVEEHYRGNGIGTRLIQTVIELLRQRGCQEVVLETEVSNAHSLSLYGRLGFIRDARLFRYYLNGGDAFRLKLFLEEEEEDEPPCHAAASSSSSHFVDHHRTFSSIRTIQWNN